MLTAKSLTLALTMFLFAFGFVQQPHSGGAPRFTPEGQMEYPADYRSWVYLTTGFDMSYSKDAATPDHHMFDNVFVNPEAYQAFLATGTWPDHTVLVLENRMAKGKGSINVRGNYQSSDVMGVEVHVKDTARFTGGWAFFAFGDGDKPAKMIPQTATCYTCHQAHAAVDTTFVQFYPTLLGIAEKKKTLSPAYLREASGPE